MSEQTSLAPGQRPSVVEYFSIDGVHGYKDLSFASPYAATVLIAGNGAGKTTVLAALDAFLKGEFTRLLDISFSRIRCKLAGRSSILELTRNDITELAAVPTNPEFLSLARRVGIDPGALVDFLEYDYAPARGAWQQSWSGTEAYDKLLKYASYTGPEFRKICEQAVQVLGHAEMRAQQVRELLFGALENLTITYLPTYRRIELQLPRQPAEARHYRRRESAYAKLGLPKRGLFSAEIQLGLADVSDRLEELNQEILLESNAGYRKISATIINELIDGTLESTEFVDKGNLPDKDSLILFFSRLSDAHRENAHFSPDVPIPKIDKIYNSAAIPFESNRFLQYFLRKLNTVIEATHATETRVEQFIKKCNEYLLDPDKEGDGFDAAYDASQQDAKVLKLDKRTLRVHVESAASGRPIPLGALSSGEKQMISLFGRVYLYGKKQLILIDEPELSLSLDWQRRILVDVLAAESCAQVVAITHSPFVFDNSLSPFARGLDVKIHESQMSLIDEFEDDAAS